MRMWEHRSPCRSLLSLFALFAIASACPLAIGATTASRDQDLDLTLSRGAPVADLIVSARTQIVLRLDRDIRSVRLDIRPLRDEAATGEWRSKLYMLPSTIERDRIDTERALRETPVWSEAGTVTRSSPWTRSLPAPVPRPDYRNYLLVLSPAGQSSPVELKVVATPATWAMRVQWLMGMRAQWQPSERPDLTRELMRRLTDEEVRYWTGIRDRESFNRIWYRMTAAEIAREFPGPEGTDVSDAGHTLPNSLVLSSDGYTDPTPEERRADGGFPPPAIPPGTWNWRGAPLSLEPTSDPPAQVQIGSSGARYVARVRRSDGTCRIRLHVSPEVRSVQFRVTAPAAARGEESVRTVFDLVEVIPSGEPGHEAFRGRVTSSPNPDAPVDQRAWRLFTAEAWLPPREKELVWDLRLQTVGDGAEAPRPPLDLSLQVTADTRPLTPRERELMAWRRGIADPLTDVEAVRAKVRELTDEEVSLYTGFPDRDRFLKYWGRTRRADLVGPDGSIAITPDNAGLFYLGTPLPDGKYLHHNGRLPPLQ